MLGIKTSAKLNKFKVIAGVVMSLAIFLLVISMTPQSFLTSSKEGGRTIKCKFAPTLSSRYKGLLGGRRPFTFPSLNLKTSSLKDIVYHKGRRKDRFFYLKIGKTGSSTAMHIFHSYGYRHKLNIMMSIVGSQQINPRDLDSGSSWMVGPASHPIHVLSQHITYNQTFQEKFFPDQTTTLITSVRDPVKFFISYVDFMAFLYPRPRPDPRMVLHDDKLFYKPCNRLNGLKLAMRNMQLQWLGFDVKKMNDEEAIREYIKFLDTKFDLILVTEYFDESLVLLKRLMNWDMTEIFYRFANEATKKSGIVLNETEVEKLLDEKHNLGDKLMYDHFNQTLWEKIGREKEFTEEVSEFKLLNGKVVEFCNSKEQNKFRNGTLTINTKWDGTMTLTDDNCLSARGYEETVRKLKEYIPEWQNMSNGHSGTAPTSCRDVDHVFG